MLRLARPDRRGGDGDCHALSRQRAALSAGVSRARDLAFRHRYRHPQGGSQTAPDGGRSAYSDLTAVSGLYRRELSYVSFLPHSAQKFFAGEGQEIYGKREESMADFFGLPFQEVKLGIRKTTRPLD